jgi:hypothetical protein
MEDSSKVVFEIISKELENERRRLDQIESKATKFLTIVSVTTTAMAALSSQIISTAKIQFASQSISGLLFAVATTLFFLQILVLMGSITTQNYPVIQKDLADKLENQPEDAIYYSMTKAYNKLYAIYYKNNNRKALWLSLCQWMYVVGLLLSVLSLIVK